MTPSATQTPALAGGVANRGRDRRLSTSTAWATNRAYQSPSLIGGRRHTQSGIARHERLREHDELGARRRDVTGGHLERGGAIEEDRRGLHGRHRQRSAGEPSKLMPNDTRRDRGAPPRGGVDACSSSSCSGTSGGTRRTTTKPWPG